jgi:tetratricopeptide (TPR) repeat protein
MNQKLTIQIVFRWTMKQMLTAIVVFIMMFFAINTASTSQASLNSDVKRAKAFMAAGMYPQAIELLDKRINEKQTDVEAHFQLGICHIKTGSLTKANKQFVSTVGLKPDYGYKIGGECKTIGDQALNNGDYGRAKNLYQLAVKYQPNLKGKIAKDCFEQGQNHFNYKNYGPADSIFTLAAAFDSSYNQQISEMYFNLGNSVDGIHCIDYYRISAKYSDSYNQKIGQNLAALTMVRITPEADKKIYKKEASKYLSKVEMKKAFPPD